VIRASQSIDQRSLGTQSADLTLGGVEYSFDTAQRVVGPLDLTIAAGERVALVGRSGSGKSTLLQLMCGVLRPAKGSIRLGDIEMSRLDQDERARLRLERFGIVFQFAELVPELTLAENVELPLRILGTRRQRNHVDATLERLGIAHLARQLPSQVSGGERQRAALARAIIHRPSIILADEPTGSLDEATGAVVLDLLLECSREQGATLVVVTHDQAVAERLDRTIRLSDGVIAE